MLKSVKDNHSIMFIDAFEWIGAIMYIYIKKIQPCYKKQSHYHTSQSVLIAPLMPVSRLSVYSVNYPDKMRQKSSIQITV